MKKSLLIILVLFLVSFAGCVSSSDDKKADEKEKNKENQVVVTPTAASIEFSADTSKIIADGEDVVNFSAIVKDKDGNKLDNQNIEIIQNENTLGKTFKSTTAGAYLFFAKVGNVTSSAIEIKVTDTSNKSGKMESIIIDSHSIATNLLNDNSKREVMIYTPPSYNYTNKKYPLLVYLTGHGGKAKDDASWFNTVKMMDTLLKNKKTKEFIMVFADGKNKFDGSFYVNSKGAGNWEDFICKEVVGYVDKNYRAKTSAESRGIWGHSMGGFGSLNIAMRNPDIFSVVYSLSPGLYEEDGIMTQIFSTESRIRNRLSKYEAYKKMTKEEFAKVTANSDWNVNFDVGYGMAFCPSDEVPYFKYPYKLDGENLVRDEELYKMWQSGFGGIAEEAKQYKDNFLKLKGIVVDYGLQDNFAFIPKGCIYFNKVLNSENIPNEIRSYTGDHSNRITERVEKFVLPYFSEKLK